VNFAENVVTKPSKKNIRRIYNTGIWLNLQSSDYTSQIHAKINNLQIDSQIDNCIFPVIFAPVPPPKTIAQTGTCSYFIKKKGIIIIIIYCTLDFFELVY